MHPYTLPLFEQLVEPAFDGVKDQPLKVRPDLARAAQSAARRRQRKRLSEGEKHLAAARRLSKAMWRLPDGSAQQTQAGQEICRHLLASLADWSDSAP